MESVGSRKIATLGALLFGALFFATLVTGCFDDGWGGGGPGYYPSYGTAYPSNYYSTNVYRGYGGYSQPGLFGGYAPAHEAWDESSRGRTSYDGGGGEHGGGGERGGGGGEHRGGDRDHSSSGRTGGGEKAGGESGHGH